jgi:hypothetical protein
MEGEETETENNAQEKEGVSDGKKLQELRAFRIYKKERVR